MPLSPLAASIYSILRARATTRNAELQYADLVRLLDTAHAAPDGLNARDTRLFEALGELITTCQAGALPPISALVYSAEGNMPGIGYFLLAHPKVKSKDKHFELWLKDVKAVREATWPEVL